jgi:transcriptional regulator with XRE-family HTH domain
MKNLGKFIRTTRDEKDLSLRELARRAQISAAFLSDIELGRRYPSEDVLSKLAKALNVSLADLQSEDSRPPLDEMKRITELNPLYGVAFRKIIDEKISAEDLIKLAQQKKKK